jgi:hypothetical protein
VKSRFDRRVNAASAQAPFGDNSANREPSRPFQPGRFSAHVAQSRSSLIISMGQASGPSHPNKLVSLTPGLAGKGPGQALRYDASMILTGNELAFLSAAFGAVCGKALDLVPFKKITKTGVR